MKTISSSDIAFVFRCEHLGASGVRRELANYPHLDVAAIEVVLKDRLEGHFQRPEYIQGLVAYRKSLSTEAQENRERAREYGVPEFLQGLPEILIALLPSSYGLVKSVLSMTVPKAVYEMHFTMFALLERQEFNSLEQDGIELLLREYLMKVRSTAAFAAWKAGLVLAEEWLSDRSESLLIELMASARFPAGRLGAINGYRWLVAHRRTFSHAEFEPLSRAAQNDPSERVRGWAKFHLKEMRRMKDAAENSESS
jgi:hypothetical protein